MKPIKVNGVVVHCSDCINHMVSIDDAPFRVVGRRHSIKHDFGKEAKAWSVMILYLVMRTTDTNLSVKARTKKSSASVQRWSE